MKFEYLADMNEHINKNPENILSIDIEKLEVEYISRYSVQSVSLEKKHNCYIVFENKKSYEEYLKENKVNYSLPEINTINTHINTQEISKLRNILSVEYIDIIDENQNEEVEVIIDGTEYSDIVNWGAKYANIENYWNNGYTGKGVNIGIIDTMFDQNSKDVNIVDYVSDIMSSSGSTHGMRVANVAAATLNNQSTVGNAYGANIYAYAAQGNPEMLASGAIDRGLNYFIKLGNIDVINMSFGLYTKTSYTRGLLFEKLYDQGCTLVASAGNNVRPGSIHTPSEHHRVVCVAGVEKTSYGGIKIVERHGGYEPSAQFLGPSVAVEVSENDVAVGTSFAAPWIAGFVALLKEKYPNDNTEELLDRMRMNSEYGFAGSKAFFPKHENPIPRPDTPSPVNPLPSNTIKIGTSNNQVLDVKKIQINTGIPKGIVDIKKIQTKVNGKILDLYARN